MAFLICVRLPKANEASKVSLLVDVLHGRQPATKNFYPPLFGG
jgi:hypothetical protein